MAAAYIAVYPVARKECSVGTRAWRIETDQDQTSTEESHDLQVSRDLAQIHTHQI